MPVNSIDGRHVSAASQIFVKIIVADEEAMADYYIKVYGLKVVHRVEGLSGGTNERFREVILSLDGTYATQTFVLFNFIDRSPPRDQQSLVGWVTGDLPELCGKIEANGGKLIGPMKDMPEHGVKVQFSQDPEGALCENVQLL